MIDVQEYENLKRQILKLKREKLSLEIEMEALENNYRRLIDLNLDLSATFNLEEVLNILLNSLKDIFSIEYFYFYLETKNETIRFCADISEDGKYDIKKSKKDEAIEEVINQINEPKITQILAYKNKWMLSYYYLLDNGFKISASIINTFKYAFGEYEIQLYTEILDNSINSIENYIFVNKLNEMAVKDELTKLYNRRYFFKEAEKRLNELRLHNIDFSVIMLDIDHFKKVNDSYGHQVGDLILMGISKTAMSIISENILLARYGGEEFVMFCYGYNEKQAYELAENLRKKVDSTKYEGLNITLSLGLVSNANELDRLQDIVDLADQALYCSKENGRNRVTVYKPEKTGRET